MAINSRIDDVPSFIKGLFIFGEDNRPERALWHTEEIEYLIRNSSPCVTSKSLKLPEHLKNLDENQKAELISAYKSQLNAGENTSENTQPKLDLDFDSDLNSRNVQAKETPIITLMNKEFENRVAQLSPLDRILLDAQRGNPSSQTLIGKIYLEGWFGKEKDYASAAEWLAKAANQGDPEACWALAHARTLEPITGSSRYFIESSEKRKRYKEYAIKSGLTKAEESFHNEWHENSTNFDDDYEEMSQENRMLDVRQFFDEIRNGEYGNIENFVTFLDDEISYRKSAWNRDSLKRERGEIKVYEERREAKNKRLLDGIPRLIATAKAALMEAAKHTTRARYLLATSSNLIISEEEKRELVLSAAFPSGGLQPDPAALVVVAKICLRKDSVDYDPSKATNCLELAKNSGNRMIREVASLIHADHLLVEAPNNQEAMMQAKRIYGTESEMCAYAKLMHDFIEMKSSINAGKALRNDLFHFDRSKAFADVPIFHVSDSLIYNVVERNMVSKRIAKLLNCILTLPRTEWIGPLLECLDLWPYSVSEPLVPHFCIEIADVRALARANRYEKSFSIAAENDESIFCVVVDPFGDLSRIADVIALTCNWLAHNTLHEGLAYELAVRYQSIVAGYLLISCAAQNKTPSLSELDIETVIDVIQHRINKYASEITPGMAGPDGSHSPAKWLDHEFSFYCARYKNLVLRAKNRDLLKAENEARMARDSLEREKKDLVNLMKFVTHEFRGCVQSISDAANSKQSADSAYFADQARKMNGFLELFSLLGTKSDRLKAQLKRDDAGAHTLEDAFYISLWLALSQLVTPRGLRRMSRQTLRHAMRLGRVNSAANLKQWMTNREMIQIRKEIERDWSNQVRLLANTGDFSLMLKWSNDYLVPIDSSELVIAAYRFDENGPKESLFTVVMTELLVNAISYYDTDSTVPVSLAWHENDNSASLICRNPTTEAICNSSFGSHGGLDSMMMLSENIKGKFTFVVEGGVATAQFFIPIDLMRGGNVVVPMG